MYYIGVNLRVVAVLHMLLDTGNTNSTSATAMMMGVSATVLT